MPNHEERIAETRAEEGSSTPDPDTLVVADQHKTEEMEGGVEESEFVVSKGTEEANGCHGGRWGAKWASRVGRVLLRMEWQHQRPWKTPKPRALTRMSGW